MKSSTMAWLCGGALVAGCATAPPQDLRDARVEYERARSGPAARLAPAAVARAGQALSQAEQSFAGGPRDPITRDLAYAAKREAETAQSTARSVQEEQRRAAAAVELAAAQRQLTDQATTAEQRAAADRARAEAARLEAEAATSQAGEATQLAEEQTRQRQAAEVETQKERDARVRAEAALERVQQFATVRNEARGRVITLNGSILFTSGTAQLLPAARLRLDEVAQALQNERAAQFTIEGFTDARGSAARNLELSEARATAVRDYLVTRGVDPDRVRAIGRGEAQPVATNDTADGRANNRRVEIIISRRQAER